MESAEGGLRINKFLARCGAGSRRQVERLVLDGRVTADGETVRDLSFRVEPGVVVRLDGRRLELPARARVVLFHKPVRVLCSAKDPHGRRTIYDVLPPELSAFRYVGRLDWETRGLLLLTDDGDLANRLTHPRHEIPKIYEVSLTAPPSEKQLRALTAPMELDGYSLLPVGLRRLSADKLELTLWEGRNRQIRRMCEAVGLNILRLCRVAVGEIRLGDLPAGKWRELTEQEVEYLKSSPKPKESET